MEWVKTDRNSPLAAMLSFATEEIALRYVTCTGDMAWH